ncbi:hypothetical protein SCP_0207350 [Sparassis crispa]|uniref:Uncharacterized protein n=1 Tax=Sparassis crispa TaxID=139825 RepID=A0A401GBJ5_9APHY|nr:hypothetical protein SCP_0207350 [Sparassis crispa]GBE79535.1 hypothetical protein SCP_0207350 [Sparassis crispa]
MPGQREAHYELPGVAESARVTRATRTESDRAPWARRELDIFGACAGLPSAVAAQHHLAVLEPQTAADAGLLFYIESVTENKRA